MQHDLENTIALLSRTPAVLDALLRSLPDAWTTPNEGEGTFNAWDVVAHLSYADRENWIPRAHLILDHGEELPFGPFDRLGHRKASEGQTLPQLLDEFALVRTSSLKELRSLDLGPAELAKTGRHPSFGPVTLDQLLATWAAHDLTHLHQLSRLMAHQYREAVGPWSSFLGVLRCGGHSA